MSNKPAPQIETARTRLRMFTFDDLDGLQRIVGDRDVVRYLEKGEPLDREKTAAVIRGILSHWERHGIGRWAVVHKEGAELMGWAGLRLLEGVPEIVYLLAREFWGRGLATEVAGACLRYAFERCGFERVVAITKPENVASQRVMKKLGMSYEGEARYYGFDVVQYAIAREDYRPQDFPCALS